MKIIHRYIAGSFLSVFTVALFVLCFVLSIGFLFKAASMISAGASIRIVLRFIWAGLPFTLSLAIPVAALVSSILVFGRLSADSEISAMRACGFPLRSIMAMPLVIGFGLSAFCFYLSGELGPDSIFSRNAIRTSVQVPDILSVIRPGRFVDDIPGMLIFVGERQGHTLSDVRILETMKNGGTREIRAECAVVTNATVVATNAVEIVETNTVVCFEMFAVTMEPVVEDRPGAGEFGRIVRLIPQERRYRSPDFDARRVPERRSLDMIRFLMERWNRSDSDEKTRILMARMTTELSKRMVLSLASFCFILMAIPLNIKSHRQESSAGTIVSIALAGLFYVFIVFSESLAKGVWDKAWTLTWIPVVLCLVLGVVLVRRNP